MSAGGDLPQSSPSSPPPEETGERAGAGWGITAAGSLGFDDLTTTAGRRSQVPGGSALYFSLAAARLSPVRVAAVVGSDGSALLDILDAAAVERSSVTQLAGATYRWRAQHHPSQGVPVHEKQQLGVYVDWRPELTPAARGSEILFLGSMHPARQLEVLQQCRAARLVALDTMRDFIASAREELEQLLQQTDVLFVNEGELRALFPSPRHDPLTAAREAVERWHLKDVILKLGARGAATVSATATREFPTAAGPSVVDPTGAGDALAGGLLGRLARLQRTDSDAIEEAMLDGSSAARAAIAQFGAGGLMPMRE
ncbi:MAG TPA: PfkB family carbohydrate kinase [Candidatus Saccharimonadales bacterium]|nr:PfkB family carbohydrate kinase [Candidatus Saccharimonadales bacterium]